MGRDGGGSVTDRPIDCAAPDEDGRERAHVDAREEEEKTDGDELEQRNFYLILRP